MATMWYVGSETPTGVPGVPGTPYSIFGRSIRPKFLACRNPPEMSLKPGQKLIPSALESLGGVNNCVWCPRNLRGTSVCMVSPEPPEPLKQTGTDNGGTQNVYSRPRFISLFMNTTLPSIGICRDDFTLGARAQSPNNHEAGAVFQEPDRAVGQQDVGAAGVEAA
jgi:hypothetical protein